MTVSSAPVVVIARPRHSGFGRPFTIKGEYRTIEPPHVLAFTWLPDGQQNPTETLVRFDLTEKDGLTTVRLRKRPRDRVPLQAAWFVA
jgi:uncharacterized protein YndB with AHSA1/START domain